MEQVLLAHAYLLDYSVSDDRGKTLLHHLAWSSRTSRETFERVSARSGRINSIVDGEQRSVLHYAAQRGNIAVVGYILAHLGLNINLKDRVGRTPLHYAVESSRAPMTIRLLVSNGADSRAQDDKGWSALDLAVKRDRKSAIQAFVDAGLSGELLMEDYCGQTPTEIAEKREAQKKLPTLDHAIDLRRTAWQAGNLNSSFEKAAQKIGLDPEDLLEYTRTNKLNFAMLRGYMYELLSERIVLAMVKHIRKALRLFSFAVLLCGIWLIIRGK